MRIEFRRRENGTSTERLVDGFIFVSGGIFQMIDRVGLAAEQHGFAGKVRLDVITQGLLDHALAPLEEQYSDDALAQAAEVLTDAIERIGREFFPEQYEDAA